jgi:hypothetical protein
MTGYWIKRSAIQLRFFAFGWRAFDTALLRDLPDVANLSIDPIRGITDFASIASFGPDERPYYWDHYTGL